MSYLIDTNIISELRKQNRADAGVRSWYGRVASSELHLSVLVLGEIRQGVERVRRRDPDKAAMLERWLNQVKEAFGPRVLPITVAVAEEWGRLNRIHPLPVVDSLLAATASIHGLTLVTRNISDVAATGVDCLDPFAA